MSLGVCIACSGIALLCNNALDSPESGLGLAIRCCKHGIRHNEISGYIEGRAGIDQLRHSQILKNDFTPRNWLQYSRKVG